MAITKYKKEKSTVRTLRFIINEQIITRDPNCSFDDLVPGTEGYLQAEFLFSPEWDGLVKVAAFYSSMKKEYQPQILKDGKTCMIPPEASKLSHFQVRVIGKKGGLKLTTNKVSVNQNGKEVGI